MDLILERVQNKFACIIGELCSEPIVLSKFAIWLDLRLAEYKAKGAISLDCLGENPDPIWLKGHEKPLSDSTNITRPYSASPNQSSSHGGFSYGDQFGHSGENTRPVVFETHDRLSPQIVEVKKESLGNAKEVYPVSLHVGGASEKRRDLKRTAFQSDSENFTDSSPSKKWRSSSLQTVTLEETNQSLMSIIGESQDNDEDTVSNSNFQTSFTIPDDQASTSSMSAQPRGDNSSSWSNLQASHSIEEMSMAPQPRQETEFNKMARSTKYRQQLKERDKEKYLEYLEKQRIRSRERRKRIKDNANLGIKSAQDKLKQMQEQGRLRLLRFRNKARSEPRKIKFPQCKPSPKSSATKNVNTRFSLSNKREYWKIHKRQYRAQLSAQKKRRIQEKDTKKRRETRRRQQEALRKISEKGFQSKKTMYNRTHKARRALPTDPKQFATVVDKLVSRASPQKGKALAQVGIEAGTTKRPRLLNHAIKSLPTSVTKAAVGILKKYASQRSLSTSLKLNWKTVSRACIRGSSRKVMPPRINTSKVTEFFKREDVSRQLPNKRYARKEGLGFLMQISLKAAFAIFKKENPTFKIGFTKFTLLRPKNVRLISISHREFCLCPHCLNVKYKLLTLNRVAPAGCKIPDENSLVETLLCSKPDASRFHAANCLLQNCTKCQDHADTLRKHYAEIDHSTIVTWNHWERGIMQGKVRRMLKTKKDTVAVLIDEFVHDICQPTQGVSYISHLFTAHWQQKQFSNLKGDLPAGWVLSVFDFAKNRNVFFQDEIKEAFFAQQQITVHPVVSYYKSGDDLVRDVLIFLSDDRNHDFNAVKHFLEATKEHLGKQGVTVEKMVIFSDGCAAQYKGSKSFADLSLDSVTIDRNFFGSEHGKGEADGETVVLNRSIDRAIVGRQVIIRDAKELYEWCEDNLVVNETLNKRHFVYVPTEAINRDRPYTNVCTLNGCRKIHQAVNNPQQPYQLKIRHLSCFCASCRSGNRKCLNNGYVTAFKKSNLTVKAGSSVEVETPDNQVSQADIVDTALADILEDLSTSSFPVDEAEVAVDEAEVAVDEAEVAVDEAEVDGILPQNITEPVMQSNSS